MIAAAGSDVEIMNDKCRDGTVQVKCNGYVFTVDPMFLAANMPDPKIKNKRR